MKVFWKYIGLLMAVVFVGCTVADDNDSPIVNSDARELEGIEAVIEGTQGATRAGTVNKLTDYVGRSIFKPGDQIVFTNIRRTTTPLEEFTYPGKNDNYLGIIFQAGDQSGWARTNDGAPERIYWTDAVNDHTFVAYGIPQDSYEWKTYQLTEGSGENVVKKTYYVGSLGNPTQTASTDIIDYSLTSAEQDPYTTAENNTTVYRNPKLDKEDLLIAYDKEMQAEPGGSVALVSFHHALSSVRVVVNISGFSSSSSAADNSTVVSNMRLLHQPTMYLWEQSDWQAQPFRAPTEYAAAEQKMVNKAWTGDENNSTGVPQYDQRKDIKLWIPRPNGAGTNQSKTFTFYGITTPQPKGYISTLDGENVKYQKTELKFDVTYPDPLKPSTLKTHTYTATLPYYVEEEDQDKNVYFEAGYNTTINISLNHKNEKMTVGAEYENWQFVATPDEGTLKKNSTLLQDTERSSVTIVGDEKATIDDATWLYELNNTVYDIYGHTGTETDPYQISTAYQLLSFAYEVTKGNNGAGRDFNGKFIRLDADITLQPTADLTKDEMVQPDVDEDQTDWEAAPDAISWIGIGDADHAFNGTFLGGKRFIYRLKGSPLFYKLGENARIEQLQVNSVHKPDGSAWAVTGGGMYANTNAGLICGCKVVGDVAFNEATAGAFVGTNTGIIWASYHIGLTMSTSAEGTVAVGGLVGSNSGTIASCYHAGKVSGKSGTTTTGGITASNSGTLDNNYYNSTLLTPTYTPQSGVTDNSSSEMTKLQFVTDLNNGIDKWRSTDTEHGGLNHPDYHEHQYVYQPANYPKLNE